MEAEGISEKTAKLIIIAKRAGEQACHKSAWNKWVGWFTQRQIEPFWCSVKFVTNFLAALFETRLEYCTLNSYRSAVSAFHENGNSVPTGKHPLVSSLKKGIGNSCPRLLNITLFEMDIEQVLKHISRLPPNNKLSLKLLSLKLAMLLVLAAMNRGSEIKNVDTIFLAKSKNKAVFSLKGFTKYQNQANSHQM